MVVLSAKDLMNNGGVWYASNKLVSKIGKNVVNHDNIHIKNNNSIFLYKKINVKNDENSIIVTFECKKNRVVFVVPRE